MSTFRRRLMMQTQGGVDFSKDYIPLCYGVDAYTKAELIDTYGNLFEIAENAEDEIIFKNYRAYKNFALAISKNTGSIQLGGNTGTYVAIVYEDGVATGTYGNGKFTHTFNSTESCKAVVTYTWSYGNNTYSSVCGNQNIQSKWLIQCGSAQVSNSYFPSSSLYQFHYKSGLDMAYQAEISGRGTITAKGSNCYIYFKNNTRYQRATNVSVIRFNKPQFLQYSLYQATNLTDIYVQYGIGEVPTVSWVLGSTQKTINVHCLDLGNDEDNATLRQEFIDKGWALTKFKSIINDAQYTEPTDPALLI